VIHNTTTRLEQQELVKVLEEDGRRLMDSAENSLAVGSKLLKETGDVECSLRVESRGRFCGYC